MNKTKVMIKVEKRRHWLGEEKYGIWGGGLQTNR